MSYLVTIAMVIVLLLSRSYPLTAGESPCLKLPEGSLSRIECESNLDKRKQAEQIKESQKKSIDIQLGNVDDYICAGSRTPEVSETRGTVGEQVAGTFRNIGGREARGVTVYFMLYNERNELLDRISAPVFPGTLAPGASGTFRTMLPSPSRRGWTCFRYLITELADWYTK